jgi:sn-glycerol 3-phosphate transport system permease protein
MMPIALNAYFIIPLLNVQMRVPSCIIRGRRRGDAMADGVYEVNDGRVSGIHTRSRARVVSFGALSRGDFAPYLYILPSLLIFSVFVYFPFIKTAILSLSLTNRRGRAVEFVAFENYLELFSSPDFWNSISLTFRFAFMLIVPTIVISLFLSLLAFAKIKGGRVFELFYSMPAAIASAPAAMIWLMITHPTNGILNRLLRADVFWLSDPKLALITVAVVTVWLAIGMSFIFLFTGLKSIPKELIESAMIDGANYAQRAKSILLPMLSPQLFFVFFLNTAGAFQAFAQIKLLTQGGPGDSTNVLVHAIYKDAFINGRFDMASAQSLVLFAIVFLITLGQFACEKRSVHYNGR